MGGNEGIYHIMLMDFGSQLSQEEKLLKLAVQTLLYKKGVLKTLTESEWLHFTNVFVLHNKPLLEVLNRALYEDSEFSLWAASKPELLNLIKISASREKEKKNSGNTRGKDSHKTARTR